MTNRIKCNNVQIGSNFILPLENPYKDEQTALEKMIEEANAKKDKLIQEGAEQAKQLVEEAKQILVQAQENAKKIIEDANTKAISEADEIRENARKEGYEAGNKQGYEDGTNSLEEKFLAIDTFAKCQFDLKHNIIKSAELDIVELVLDIARKVCKKIFDNDKEILKLITSESIKQLKDKETITITINPKLAEKIYSISEELKNEIPKLESIKVLEDSNISDDGAIVESLLSRVDNRLKIQIDQIAEKMLIAHYSSDNENNTEEEEIEFSEIAEVKNFDSEAVEEDLTVNSAFNLFTEGQTENPKKEDLENDEDV
ncbi:hypothetical protein IJ843_01075 [bacterium]|nr:hypothetical protein [bacterium]